MPYIGRNGEIVEKRSPWRLSIITDVIFGIWNFILLFFKTLTTPKNKLKDVQRRRNTTYTERNGFRRPPSGGANIRGVKNLGSEASCGGGG